MDKRELVELTIERLISNFERSPESFDLKMPSGGSYGGPCVTWRPRVELGSYDSNIVNDPNNEAAIVVQINPSSHEITCYLFQRAPHNLEGARADNSIASLQSFQRFRGHYRKLQKLIALIQKRDRDKENMNYLSKLSAVFPDTLDKHIFKD